MLCPLVNLLFGKNTGHWGTLCGASGAAPLVACGGLVGVLGIIFFFFCFAIVALWEMCVTCLVCESKNKTTYSYRVFLLQFFFKTDVNLRVHPRAYIQYLTPHGQTRLPPPLPSFPTFLCSLVSTNSTLI